MRIRATAKARNVRGREQEHGQPLGYAHLVAALREGLQGPRQGALRPGDNAVLLRNPVLQDLSEESEFMVSNYTLVVFLYWSFDVVCDGKANI